MGVQESVSFLDNTAHEIALPEEPVLKLWRSTRHGAHRGDHHFVRAFQWNQRRGSTEQDFPSIDQCTAVLSKSVAQ